MQILIIFIVVTVVFTIIFYLYKRIQITEAKITILENRLKAFEVFGTSLSEFVERGEDVSRIISNELNQKQFKLKKLLKDAQETSSRLQHIETKLKSNKINKEQVENILILVNQGFKAKDIAPRLNLPIGEVELIVKLKEFLNKPFVEKL